MKLFAILFVCLLANEINGFSNRMCGPQLAEIMWAVCKNGFNELLVKRSGPWEPETLAIEGDIESPYSASALSNVFQIEPQNLLAKTRRIRMLGIVDECCKSSCSLSELTAYCN